MFPILNECDLKLSNCLPAEINTLRKTAENLYRVIGFPFAWQKGAPVTLDRCSKNLCRSNSGYVAVLFPCMQINVHVPSWSVFEENNYVNINNPRIVRSPYFNIIYT